AQADRRKISPKKQRRVGRVLPPELQRLALTVLGRPAKLRSSNLKMSVSKPAIQSASLLVELDSIVERLSLARLFPQPQPLEVELGCGDASFLVEYARQKPGRNFIGVERLLGRIQKLDRKGRRAGL